MDATDRADVDDRCTIPDDGQSRDDRRHLEDVEDGCGCAEIWEHMSERRSQD